MKHVRYPCNEFRHFYLGYPVSCNAFLQTYCHCTTLLILFKSNKYFCVFVNIWSFKVILFNQICTRFTYNNKQYKEEALEKLFSFLNMIAGSEIYNLYKMYISWNCTWLLIIEFNNRDRCVVLIMRNSTILWVATSSLMYSYDIKIVIVILFQLKQTL